MDWGQFFISQGPAILILVYAFLNARVIQAKQAAINLKLQADIAEAHAKIDERFAGQSADIVNRILAGGGNKP